MSAEIVNVRPTDERNQVVTVHGGGGQYRRRPCPGCPWVVENTSSFPANAFAHSAHCADDLSGHMFGCHESGTERPVTCAGFLLRGADHNMAVRTHSATGQICLDQVHGDGRELHPGYVSMAVANGLSPHDPALRNCRLSIREEVVPVSALTLLHHVPDGDVATWVFTPVSGHPPITGAMEAALRVQCVEAHRRGRARSVTWHHCDGNAWAAVTDLHRAGRHEDAVALAVLLRWCDQRYTRRAEGIWEIRTEVGGERNGA